MTKQETVSFVAPPDLIAALRQWAADDDRSVSATLRRILAEEDARRQARQVRQQPQPTVN